MSAPWWSRSASSDERPVMLPAEGVAPPAPRVFATDPLAIAAEIRARVTAFTPEWTVHTSDDAGEALVTLFSEQAADIGARLVQLPAKALVEQLRTAGVVPLAARSATAIVSFEVSASAPGAVLVAEGFQLGARSPLTSSLVTFETTRSVFVAPVTIVDLQVLAGGILRKVGAPKPEDGASFFAFGTTPTAGDALLVALDSPVELAPSVAIAFATPPDSSAPPPFATGGVTPPLPTPMPVLRWEAFVDGSWVSLELLRDETAGLARSGIVELFVPSRWRPMTPPGVTADAAYRWLRARLHFGSFASPPSFAFALPNAVWAIEGRTIRDEVLESIVSPGARGKVMRLSQTPVLPGTLAIDVDDGREVHRWTEVDLLSSYGPADEVYTLDPASGEVTFGDGRHGLALPDGFRNVVASAYRTGGGAAGAVAAKDLSTLISASPFVTSVSNPSATTGGVDVEPRDKTLLRGPKEIASRGRAVTTSDFELLACRAEGADVRRAHAVSGLHPAFSGLPIPGVVGVFVVPPVTGDGPPIPNDQTLRAVATWLADSAALLGIDVVCAAPKFHRVRAEIGVVFDPTVDVGEAVSDLTAVLNAYLDPLVGGADGQGWPFGGAIRWVPLAQHLLTTPRVPGALGNLPRALPRLNLVVDGVRVVGCRDQTIDAHALLWPETHEIIPLGPQELP